MIKFSLITGAIFAALSVMIGAFGAHSLAEILQKNQRLDTFDTAVKYQMFHSIGILITGLLIHKFNINILNWSVYLFIAGILIFSGSLYILSITNIKWLGAITPIGGLAFIAGWIIMIFGILKIKI
jgi:uncharacterized membrane protein YgdD (TMEM256/DUF423 family)